MRRFLSTLFIVLTLVISAAGAAPAAHAQGPGPEFDTSQINAQAAAADAGATAAIANGSDVGAAAQTAAQKAAAATPNPFAGSPPIAGPLAQIMNFIMSLFAWLLGVAMITLDNAVYYTVVTMGTYVNHLNAVGVTWRILRDIGNIMLIFGFLAVGITTILNVDWYGGGKKMLPMMLVAAVFLNFSLFISEAIIDTGNLFATQFYTQINGGNSAQPINYFDSGSIANEGVSNKIMSQLGLATIYGAALKNDKVLPDGTSVFIGFMSIILFLIAAFVMFSLAFILIARFVALIFLIILAPIGFAGLAVPMLKKRADQWWGKLFEQTITAPILLLMLYIALAVITDANFLGFGPKGDWAGFVPSATGATNYAGFAGIMLSFLVAMGLLLLVVVQAKNLSAFGAAGATKLAGKLTFGATAFGMRSTAGWGLNSAARRFRSSKLARVPVLGRMVAGGLDRGAKASFDVRGATIGGGLKGIGIDAGKAQEGGYRKQLETAVKGREEHAKTLELSTKEKTKAKQLEQDAEQAKDAYEQFKSPQTKLDMINAQKAASDARGAAQLGYAKGLETMPWGWLYRNEKAASNIRKTVEKSKDQKDIDTLMDLLKNKPPPPPPPPPPPGGGGGTP